MTWAPQEAQKSFFALLAGDAALVALLGGTLVTNPKVFDTVPDNTPYPYVTLYILPFTDRGNHTLEGLDAEFQVSVWGQERGNKQVQEIQKRIDELIHKQSPCIDGWNIVGLRRTLIDIILLDDNITRQGVQRFHLMVGES